MHRARRRLVRLLQLVIVGCSLVLAIPVAASAHAQLDRAMPAAGSQLTASPPVVSLKFSEHVEISLGAIRLFDHDGKRVATEPASHPDGDATAVSVALPKLADGQYVVSWRVVSADSHPIHAAYVFTVGTAGSKLRTGLVADLLARDGGDSSVGAALAVDRMLVFAALAALIGAAGFLMLCWPDEQLPARIVPGLMAIGVVGAVASLAQVGLEAAYGAGRSLGAAFESSGWRAVLETRPGRMWIVRTLMICALIVLVIRPRPKATWWRAAVAAAATVSAAAVAWSGHGANGRWPAVGAVATVVHVVAGSLWLGGLVMVVLTWTDARHPVVLRRFSQLAVAMVAALVGTGAVQSLRQVGTVSALTGTTYGRMLMVKLGLVAAMLALALRSRTALRTERPDRSSMRASVAIETIAGIAVIVVTSLLVNTVPARDAVSRPANGTLVQGQRQVNFEITPAKRGRNEVHAYFSDSGKLLTTGKVATTVELVLPERDLGPLTTKLTSISPSHATSNDVEFPFPGLWTVTIVARYDEFDQARFTTTVLVR